MYINSSGFEHIHYTFQNFHYFDQNHESLGGGAAPLLKSWEACPPPPPQHSYSTDWTRSRGCKRLRTPSELQLQAGHHCMCSYRHCYSCSQVWVIRWIFLQIERPASSMTQWVRRWCTQVQSYGEMQRGLTGWRTQVCNHQRSLNHLANGLWL